MGEFILFVIIFVGIMAVSALIFGGWFLVMLARGIGSFLGLRAGPTPYPHQGAAPPLPNAAPYGGGVHQLNGAVQTGPVTDLRPCAYELCKAENDASARFCRRCGRQLAAPARVRVSRAAVW